MDPTPCDTVTCIPLSTGRPPDLGWYAMWWASLLGLPEGAPINGLPDLSGNGHDLFAAEAWMPGLGAPTYDTQTVPGGAADVSGDPVKFGPFLATDPAFVTWPPLPQPFTLFMLMHTEFSPTFQNSIVFNPTITAGEPVLFNDDAPLTALWTMEDAGGTTQAQGGAVPVTAGLRLFELVFDAAGAGWSLAVNGVVEIAPTATGAGGSNSALAFMTLNDLPGFFVWAGILSSVASGAEEAAVLAWAQQVYGV